MYEFQQLVPELRPYAEALMQALTDAGANPRVTSTIRSIQTQKRLYEAYIQGNSRYPAAPPGYSAHEQGWAFDLSVNDDSWLSDAGDLWESWGGTWGGRFNDPIHFELGGASDYLHSLRSAGLAPPMPPGVSPSMWEQFTHFLGTPFRVAGIVYDELHGVDRRVNPPPG